MKNYFVIIYLVTTAITLAACSHRAESTSTIAKSPPLPAAAAPISPSPLAEPLAAVSTQAQQAIEMPPFHAPPGTSLVTSNLCISHVNAAPGKSASPLLPAGSVYIGCATTRLSNDRQEKHIPTIIEWDVAGGRVLRSIDLPVATHYELSIATFHDNVYVALMMEARDETLLFALDANLRPREARSIGISSRGISLKVSEKYLAVSFRPVIDDTRRNPLKVELFDANHLAPIATTSVGTAELAADSGYALEFFGDRLYVAGVSGFTTARDKYIPANEPSLGVFAMSLPSLEIVRTRKSAQTSDYYTTLQSAAGHIMLTGGGGYEELTADLKPIRNHKGGYATAFDPNTGRALSCRGRKVIGSECCCGVICSCHAFWTGLEAAIVADIKGHIVFGRLKDLPRGKRD
ncbi:MAG: hypothetical protein FWD73_01475 [Polyangiaceae bacterium]|nr:hypothetical protein [Polyangiaceae bacterium]